MNVIFKENAWIIYIFKQKKNHKKRKKKTQEKNTNKF